jgi:hypothetical protein
MAVQNQFSLQQQQQRQRQEEERGIVLFRRFTDQINRIMNGERSLEQWFQLVKNFFSERGVLRLVLTNSLGESKNFEIPTAILPRYFMTMIKDLDTFELHMKNPQPKGFPDGTHMFEATTSCVYRLGSTVVLSSGNGRAVYSANHQLDLLELQTQQFDEYIQRDLVPSPDKSPKKKTKQSTPELPSSPISAWGLPVRAIPFLEVCFHSRLC